MTASIDTASRVSALTTLYNPGGGNETNAWTVVISSADKTGSTAANLNTINSATSVAVDLTEVTALAASDMSDLQTLNTNKDGLSNRGNLASITLTDNGGSGTEVDFGTLADIVDDSQTNFKNTVTFKFQAGDTIDIDDSTELGKFVTDIGSGALTLTDQKVTVDLSLIHI